MSLFGLTTEEFAALANLVLSAGLLIFTGAQVWLAWHGEKRERLAREEAARIRTDDANSALDTAFQQVWAEHFRLDSLAKQWERADLVEWSLAGLLRPEDVRLRDPALMMDSLARLGPEASYLGAVALTLSADVAHQIAMFNAGIADTAKLRFPDRDRATQLEEINRVGGTDLQTRVDSLRKGLRELALLTWDAVSHSSRAKVVRKMNFNDDVRSTFAKAAVAALVARGEKS